MGLDVFVFAKNVDDQFVNYLWLIVMVWFGLVWFMVLNATFNNISVISWCSVYWWKKPEYPEKTTDLPKVT